MTVRHEDAWKYLVNTISSVYSFKRRDEVYSEKGNVEKSCKDQGFKELSPFIKEILSLRLSNYKIPKYLYDYTHRRHSVQTVRRNSQQTVKQERTDKCLDRV